jgi:hypothetical protein
MDDWDDVQINAMLVRAGSRLFFNMLLLLRIKLLCPLAIAFCRQQHQYHAINA